MKNYRILLTMLLLLSGVLGQAQVYQNNLHFESNTVANLFRGVAVDSEGNFYYTGAPKGTFDYDYVTGSTPVNYGPVSTYTAGVLAKYTKDMGLLWLKGLSSTTGNVVPREIYVDASDNLLLAATFKGTLVSEPAEEIVATSQADGSALFAKYNKNGALQWSKVLGNLEASKLQAITADKSGNVFLGSAYKGTVEFASGETLTSSTDSTYNVFFAKYSSSGTFLWKKNIIPSTGNAVLSDVKTDASGNVYACGYASAPSLSFNGDTTLTAAGSGSTKGYVVKYSSDGTFLWASVYGMKKESDTSSGNFTFNDMDVDGAGNCYLVASGSLGNAANVGTYNLLFNSSTGSESSIGMGNYTAAKPKGLWMKLDTNGEYVNSFLIQVLDGLYECNLNSVKVDGDGFSYVGGNARSNIANPVTVSVEGTDRTPTARGSLDFIFAKLNPEGGCVSFKRNGSGKDEWIQTNGIALDAVNNKLYVGIESNTISGKPLYVDLKYNAQVNGFLGTYTTASITKPLLAQYSLMDFNMNDTLDLIVGRPYSSEISISGNAGTVTSGYSGSLPSGITCTPSGTTIAISGTPTVSGTSTVYLKAEDKMGDANEATGYRADKKVVFNVKAPTTTIWNGEAWSNATPTSEVDAEVNGHFSGAGFSCYHLTIAAGKQLSVTSGALFVGGNATLESDATNGPATLVDNGGTVSVTGTVIVKQNLTGAGGATPSGRFWYVSSPVTGATSATFDAAGGNKLWSFTEANLGTNVYTEITGNDAVLGVGNAYVARLGADTQVSFTGTALNTGDKSVSVTRTGTAHAQRGFNLVGNPYPSFVSLSAANNTNLKTTIWYRSKVNGGSSMAFDTYNFFTNEQTVASGSGALTSYIPPMQAFWVKVNADGVGGTVAFKNANRSHNGSVKLRGAQNADIQKVRLQVSNGTHGDETLIGFYPEATDAEDDYDSPKLSNGLAAMPEIFTKVGDEEMAINGLKATETEKEVALGFRTKIAGAFTINAVELLNVAEGKSVILKDKLLGNEQDLTVTPQYSFTSEVAETPEQIFDRFSVVIGRVPTGLQATTRQFAVLNRGNGKLDIVFKGYESQEGAVCIMNALGQTVLSTTFSDVNTSVDTNLTPGIYLVNVSSKGFNATRKIIIH